MSLTYITLRSNLQKMLVVSLSNIRIVVSVKKLIYISLKYVEIFFFKFNIINSPKI